MGQARAEALAGKVRAGAKYDTARARELFAAMPGVDRLEESPVWPLRMEFHSRAWAQAPVEEVPIASLHRTQRRVFVKYLGGRGTDRGQPGRERPWIVRVGGRLWIADGHHRIVDEAMAGAETVTAYVREQEPWFEGDR